MSTENRQTSEGLKPRQLATIAALTEVLFPPGGRIAPSAEEIGLAKELSHLVATYNPRTRRFIQRLIGAVEFSSLFSRHLRPFSRLSAAAREDYIRRCEKSRFRLTREAFDALKILCQILYCSDERIARIVGYDGRPFKAMAKDPPPPIPLAYTMHPQICGSVKEEADVCIVGSGAGGAVVAKTLVEAGFSVILLEEGGPAEREDFRKLRPIERVARYYRDHGLTATLGSPLISLPIGKVVGGTTVVNSGTCFRTPPWVLEEWHHRYGVVNIMPDQMESVFAGVEEAISVRPVTDDILGANGAVLRQGAEALGVSHGPIRRPTRDCHGHGVCAFGCPIDAKLAMHLTYLPRATARGARIFARCRATKILREANRVIGVQADILDPVTEEKRGHVTVRAKVVVLAAGAIFTPLLFLRNGLGSESGQIGKNLRIHPGCGVTARFHEDLFGWKGVMQSYYVDELARQGILIEATFPPPGVTYTAGAAPSSGREFQEFLAQYKHLASAGILISDSGTGRVRRGWNGQPLIFYSLSRRDVAKVLEAVAFACRIYFAAGAREVYPMLPGLPPLTHEKELEKISQLRLHPADLKLSAYHPMGTCRMGEDPKISVVNSFGKFHGLQGLFIADGSILPSSTVVNPQITIMAMATRVAHYLTDRWGAETQGAR